MTFRDLADPKTVEQVDQHNLGGTFEYGAKLQSATLEITTDPLTKGVNKRLPWLVGMNTNLAGDGLAVSENGLSHRLNPSDFTRQ